MDGAFPSQKGQDFADSESNYPGGQGGGRGAGRSGFRGTAENAKTKLCNRWMQGDCRFGDRCNFAHGEVELRAGHDQSDDMSNGGRGYGARGGRGYGYPARGVAPGRGYGGRGGYGGGFPMMGGYPAGYGMEQPHGGYEQRPSGADDQWAAQGAIGGPNGWCMYRTKDTGEVYYHNHRTNLTQWERPADWI